MSATPGPVDTRRPTAPPKPQVSPTHLSTHPAEESELELERKMRDKEAIISSKNEEIANMKNKMEVRCTA